MQNAANEWTRFANLTFHFTTDKPTDIRVGFEQGNGSWSYIGKMCREIAEPKLTMNFGWLTDASTDDQVRSVVLHEFGHAIGMIHEHQNPEHAIQWNKDAVRRDLSGPPNNWNEQKIETNMFKHYEDNEIVGTPVDAASIMMYPIPKSWTLDNFSAGFNGQLSDVDKGLARDVYPGRR